MKKLLSLLLAAGLLLGSMAGCGTAKEKTAKDTYLFTDSCGRQVEIPEQIDSVAPSGALAQMILYTICPEKLCGLSSAFSRRQESYIDKQCWDLPVFGQLYGSSGVLNVEQIALASPDIIIDIGEAKEEIADDLDALQATTGIPVIFVEASLESMADAYDILGEILGCTERTDELSTYIRWTLSFAAESREKLTDIPSVLYVQGEYGTTVSMSGYSHSEVLDVVGVINIAEDTLLSGSTADVSMEQILLWNPDVVLVEPEGNFDEIYDDPLWMNADAVKNGRAYEIPGEPYNWIDKPPSVQRVLGILWLGNLLFPGIYDFDMVEKTQEFYQLFWGCELSAEEAEALLENSTLIRAS